MSAFLAVINIIKAVASLLPTVATLVQSVETAMPNTAGASKLDIVRAGLEKAYAVEQSVEVEFSALWPTLSGVISAVVAAYNASGLFKKATPAA